MRGSSAPMAETMWLQLSSMHHGALLGSSLCWMAAQSESCAKSADGARQALLWALLCPIWCSVYTSPPAPTNLSQLPGSKVKADLVEASARSLQFIPKERIQPRCLHISSAS